MNKTLKNLLLVGISFLMGCMPKNNSLDRDPETLEEMLAPYVISQKTFRKKYESQINSYCNLSQDPEVYLIPFDDKTPALMAVYSFNCSPNMETKKRYTKSYQESRILHGNYTVNGESVHLIGFLEPEKYPYFKRYNLNTEKSFFMFDIDRDGNADFILDGDSPIHPLPKNLDRKEITLK